MAIWSSVRSVPGGAIITPAAPASMAPRASARMAAKPGDDTPTMMGILPERFTTRRAKAMASAVSSLGASPMMPRMVRPVAPQPA